MILMALIFGVPQNFMTRGYETKLSTDIPADYIMLFNDSAKEKLVVNTSYILKGRNPISQLDYGKDYSILVYKMDVVNGIALKDLVRQDMKNTGRDPIMGYTSFGIGSFNIQYIWDSIPKAEIIRVKFYGDSLKGDYRNDSLVSCKIALNRFVIEYGKKDEVNLIIGRQNSFSPTIPVRIIFIKSGSGLYFLFVRQLHSDTVATTDVLEKLLRM